MGFLKDWLEFNFYDDLSWDNYGPKWHIDHLRPCASFNMKNRDEIYACWHWSNLIPLKSKTNAGKGSTIYQNLIDYYKNRKSIFLNVQNIQEDTEKVQRLDDSRLSNEIVNFLNSIC